MPPISPAQLLGELNTLRGLYATPRESLLAQVDDSIRRRHELADEPTMVEYYQGALGMFQPAVEALAQATETGRLDRLRELARQDKLSAAVLRDFLPPGPSVAVTAVRDMYGLADDATAECVMGLAAALDNGKAGLEEELGYQLVIGDVQRQKMHPAPFVTDLGAGSLHALAKHMGDEQVRAQERLGHIETENKLEFDRYQGLLDQLRQQRASSRSTAAPRIELARTFMTHLLDAQAANPETLAEMMRLAPEEIGLSRSLFPSGALDVYQAAERRADGDPNKVQWMRVLDYLERTPE